MNDDKLQSGRQAVERFLRRFGASAGDYRALACHAAMLLVLTPELLNYIRSEFLRDRTHWVAEADLLLSDLCREVGYEQFALRLDAREVLLDEMEVRFGRSRMEQVARRLLNWIGFTARNDARFRPHDLKSQQWGAMVYLAERREEAVREMAQSLSSARRFEARAALGPDLLRGEALWLSDVIRNLAREIDPEYPALVRYAEMTTEILTDITGEAVARLQQDAAFSRGATVAGIELAALERWLKLAPAKSGKERSATASAQAPRAEQSHHDAILRLLDGIQVDPQIGELALAVRGAVRQGDPAEITGSLGLLAPALADDGQTGPAMEFYEQQLALAEQFGFERQKIEALIGIGNLHHLRGDGAEALEAYDAARAAAEAESQSEWEAGVFAKLAQAYRRFDRGAEDTKAIQCAERAIAASRDQSLIGRMHDLIGVALTVRLRLRQTLKLDEEQAARANRSFNRALDLWRELGDRDAARRFFRQALDLYEGLTPPLRGLIDSLREKLEALGVLSFQLSTFEFTTVTLDERGNGIDRRSLTARQFVEELADGVALDMVEIPGGTFTMGSPESEPESFDDERPQHEVTVSPFYIGKFTITQAQWQVVAGWPKVERDLDPDPSNFKGDNRPVEQISWHDAQEFCARLAAKTGRAPLSSADRSRVGVCLPRQNNHAVCVWRNDHSGDCELQR